MTIRRPGTSGTRTSPRKFTRRASQCRHRRPVPNNWWTPLCRPRLPAKQNTRAANNPRTPLSRISSNGSIPTIPPKFGMHMPEQPTSSSTPGASTSNRDIHEKLYLSRYNLYHGLLKARFLKSPVPSHNVPDEVEIIANCNVNLVPPTHVVAVYSPETAPGTASPRAELYPVHEAVIRAHCPEFAPFRTSTSPCSLPVIPLRIPCPSAFPDLIHYLYLKDLSTLEKVFQLPSPSLPPQCRIPLMKQLEARACGLLRNVTAMGVVDDPLREMLALVLRRIWESPA